MTTSRFSVMAPPAKVAKGVKSKDLRMFFGPGGSQPKSVPAVQVSRARFHLYSKANRSQKNLKSGLTQDEKRYVESLAA